MEKSPRINGNRIADLMYSNQTVALMTVSLICLKSQKTTPACNKSLRKLAQPPRTASQFHARMYNITDAIFETMTHRFITDPTMVAYGEENRDWGGAFACYRGLTEMIRTTVSLIAQFQKRLSLVVRLVTPWPVACPAELMYCDFLGRAGDEVFKQMAKWQSMSVAYLRCHGPPCECW